MPFVLFNLLLNKIQVVEMCRYYTYINKISMAFALHNPFGISASETYYHLTSSGSLVHDLVRYS